MVVFSHEKEQDSLKKNNVVIVEKILRFIRCLQQKIQVLKYLKIELVYLPSK